jgi:hypothetical protein
MSKTLSTGKPSQLPEAAAWQPWTQSDGCR